MPADIKFCGMTRAEDARFAASLARYVGVIFAGGPRMLTLARAFDVLRAVPEASRVGVFGDQTAEEIAHVADRLRLAVVQLHSETDRARIEAIRRAFGGSIWIVRRVSPEAPVTSDDETIEAGDGVLVDAYSPAGLGGTGIALPWESMANDFAALRARKRPIVLAGGLRPENVGRAIAALTPDVVDVSSGVESAPGIKDHDRMRAFRDAVAASVNS